MPETWPRYVEDIMKICSGYEEEQSQGSNRRTMSSLTNFSKNNMFDFFLNSHNYRMNNILLGILLYL